MTIEETLPVRLMESCNSVSTCNLVTETELQLLFIGMIQADRGLTTDKVSFLSLFIMVTYLGYLGGWGVVD